MRFKLISTFALILFISSLNAQITGVNGRKMVLKTDLVNYVNLGSFNAAVEYPVFRFLSLEFEYKRVNQNIKPRWASEKIVPLADRKFQTIQNYYSLSIKMYNKFFAAPKGSFTYFNFGYGKSKVEGYFPDFTFNELTIDYDYNFKNFKASNITLLPMEFGFGKQWIMKKYFTFEFMGGFNLTYMHTEGAGDQLYPISGRMNATLPFSGYKNSNSQSFIYEDMKGSVTAGLNLRLRIGYLLPF